MPLMIVRQDITKMRVDAIVNTTNENMLGFSGDSTLTKKMRIFYFLLPLSHVYCNPTIFLLQTSFFY